MAIISFLGREVFRNGVYFIFEIKERRKQFEIFGVIGE